MEANIFDACLVTEELAYGCTGITTAIDTTNLGVSLSSISQYQQYLIIFYTTKILRILSTN